jgi:hypothetical protein
MLLVLLWGPCVLLVLLCGPFRLQDVEADGL